MTSAKKCFYEVLGVQRDANDDDIKKSFRKLALQLHPDKNLERRDDAKVEFQELQQAYETLSNPQERAWYDEHRYAILRSGTDEDFPDDIMDTFLYCTTTCFKGFGDDEKGFYSVYRNIFERVVAEEIKLGMDATDLEMPSFGNSLSPYEEDIETFYAVWGSFRTKLNFAWFDEYDERFASSRRESRLMVKENRKLRIEAKRQRNRRIRALVDYVKWKDKRVIAWKAQQELKNREKEALLAKKITDDKVRRQLERRQILEATNWKVHPTNHINQNELAEMEKWMANEYGDKTDEIESSEEESYLYCEVCNKSFRTEKAFMNHEKSKKHLQLSQALRDLMLKEDGEFQRNDSPDESKSDTEDAQVNTDIGSLTRTPDPSATNEPVIDSRKDNAEENIYSDDPDDLDKQDEDEVLVRNFQRVKLRKSDFLDGDYECQVPLEKTDSGLESKESPHNVPNGESKKKRRRAPKGQKSTNVMAANDLSTGGSQGKSQLDQDTVACGCCQKDFPTKTQLFKHLKQYPEHASPKIPHNSSTSHHLPNSPAAAGGIRGKKGKGRKRLE